MKKKTPDKDGFYSVNDALPNEYDMCILVGKNGKSCSGWRIAHYIWDGLRIKNLDKVIAWKRKTH